MKIATEQVQCKTKGKGLHDITRKVNKVIESSGVTEGSCTLFIQHTSASLLIQENYDPSAKADLEYFLNKLVPENDPNYTHTLEGPDDMPAHIKCALTQTSIVIPIANSQLTLGTWQGIYLWEHRSHSHSRNVVVQAMGK